MPPPERGLFVGRFQPVHRGHLEAIGALRSARPVEELLVGIGSAQLSYTTDNPFTAGERLEMLLRSLDEARIEGVRAIPIVDIGRHAEWVSYVESLLPPFTRVYTNNPLTRLLFEAASYSVEQLPWVHRDTLEGTRIRREMGEGGPWRESLPPAVVAYLEEIGGPERLRLLSGPSDLPRAPAPRHR